MSDTYRFEKILDMHREEAKGFKAHLSNLEAPDIEWMDSGLYELVLEAVYSRALDLVNSSGFRNASETFRGMLLVESRRLSDHKSPMGKLYQTLRVAAISKVIFDLDWSASLEEQNDQQ